MIESAKSVLSTNFYHRFQNSVFSQATGWLSSINTLILMPRLLNAIQYKDVSIDKI